MAAVVRYLVEDAPKRWFAEKDIGMEFLRTQPHQGNWSFTACGATEDTLRDETLTLIECHEDFLKFEPSGVFGKLRKATDRLLNRFEYTILQRCGSPEDNWDDGNWITVERCAELFSKNPPKPMFILECKTGLQ